MQISKVFFFFILGIFIFGNSIESRAAKWDKTMAHESLAIESEWLNVNRALDADDMKGRIILVDFWTYACINCINGLPDLKYLQKTFGDKLTIIGVHSAKFTNEGDRENIRASVLKYGIEYPVVNDSSFKIWSTFGVRAWPTLVLINPQGKVESAYSGEGHRQELENDINRLLAKNSNINTAALPIVLEKDRQTKSVINFPSKLQYVADFRGKPALFISDSGNNKIIGIRMNGKTFFTAGSGLEGKRDGALDVAEFNKPQGILYRNDSIYVADTGNHLIRRININDKKVETIAGTGKRGFMRNFQDKDALQTPLASPWDLEFYPTENDIAIAMAGTHQLWTYNIRTGKLNILAGSGKESIDDGSYPNNSLSQPSGLSAFNGKLYFVDSETSSLRVLENGQITTLIGTGLFDFGFVEGEKGLALMQHPIGVHADESGIFIADTYNHSIRKYDPAKRELATISGQPEKNNKVGAALDARYNEPNDLFKNTNNIYVADTNNHTIKIIDLVKNEVTKLAVLPEKETEDATGKYQDELPNLLHKSAIKVKSGEGVKIRLLLDEGWKVNREAPNWLSLYQIQNKDLVFVSSFNSRNISSNEIALTDLEPERQYKIQGTFYYCRQEAGSECYIQSHDQIVRSSPTNDGDLIEIKLLTPAKE